MTYDARHKYDAGVAESYDRDREQEAHWQAEAAFVRGYADTHRLGHTVDLPVGTGRLLDFLAGADAVTGIDISEDMLAVARRRLSALPQMAGKLMLLKADALRLPLTEASVDTVLCFRLLHLLPPDLLQPLLKEMRRICRGTALIQVYAFPDRDASAGLKRWVKALLPQRPRPWSHIESYPHKRSALEACMRSSGWAIVSRHALGRYGRSSVDVYELS